MRAAIGTVYRFLKIILCEIGEKKRNLGEIGGFGLEKVDHGEEAFLIMEDQKKDDR